MTQINHTDRTKEVLMLSEAQLFLFVDCAATRTAGMSCELTNYCNILENETAWEDKK